MKINPMVSPPSVTNAAFKALSRPEMHSDLARGFGPLSSNDVKMIEAATNTKFNWPPGEGEGFPQAADDLAMMRIRQSQEGSVYGDLTRADLTAAARKGIIDKNFLDQALDYLAKGSSDAAAGGPPPTDLTKTSGITPTANKPVTPPPDTSRKDGAFYV